MAVLTDLMSNQRRVTTLKLVLVGFSVLSGAYLLTDWLGEARHWRRVNLRAARRVAAAIATREATTGVVLRSLAELAPPLCVDDSACLFPTAKDLGGMELKSEPRRACVMGTCTEINPRERCVGPWCSRVELARADANVPTPGLDACEAEVARVLDVEGCVRQLSEQCSSPPTSFEIVVAGALRAELVGVRGDCRAQPRTSDGRFVISFWSTDPQPDTPDKPYSASVTVSPAHRSPGEIPTIMCGGCAGFFPRSWVFSP